MKGGIDRAVELQREDPSRFMPQQFENCANPEVHMKATAVEILHDLGGPPDGFVAGDTH